MSTPDQQLTKADVQAMYAERRYADIVQAKADGRLHDYLSTPNSTDDEE